MKKKINKMQENQKTVSNLHAKQTNFVQHLPHFIEKLDHI